MVLQFSDNFTKALQTNGWMDNLLKGDKNASANECQKTIHFCNSMRGNAGLFVSKVFKETEKPLNL